MQILEIPEVIVGGLSLRDLSVRFGFDSVNKIGEFEGVLNEENWNIVSNDIPVP